MTTETTTIKWGDINHHHHGMAATVKTPPTFPKAATYNGIIRCETNGTKPILQIGNESYMLAWYHDVTLKELSHPAGE